MSKSLIIALSALSLTCGSLAQAQGPYDRGGPDDRHGGMHGEYRGDDRHDDRRDEYRRDERRGPPEQRGGEERRGWEERPGYRAEGRGAGPEHRFYRGDRLPPEYRHRQYVVDDWNGHHLRQPPRGYHWVQAGDDYLLIAIASGLIAEIILGR